jgi:hypothetical protein
MTYKELINALLVLTPEQQDCDLTVYLKDSDEFLPAEFRVIEDGEGVIDDDHPVFVIDW